MKTGWIEYNGNWYYCDVNGRPSGAMALHEEEKASFWLVFGAELAEIALLVKVAKKKAG